MDRLIPVFAPAKGDIRVAIDRLLSPLTIGDLSLKNRVVMAPMTRSRASQDDDCVSDLHELTSNQSSTVVHRLRDA